MKSNAQLRRDDSDDEVPPPTAMTVGFPDMASSSHTVPPSEPEVNYAQIMEALAGVYVLHAAVYEFHAVSCASIDRRVVCLASGRDDTSSERMEQWTDGRPDRMA